MTAFTSPDNILKLIPPSCGVNSRRHACNEAGCLQAIRVLAMHNAPNGYSFAAGDDVRYLCNALFIASSPECNTPVSILSKITRAITRPIMEASILAHLDAIHRWRVDEEMLISLNGYLTACLPRLRSGPRRGSGAHPVSFVGTPSLKKLSAELREDSGLDCPIHFAATVFGRFVIAHPFEDGNGRVGRALFSAALMNRRLLTNPLRGSTATFYLYQDRISEALRTAVQTRCWEPITAALSSVIVEDKAVGALLDDARGAIPAEVGRQLIRFFDLNRP